MKYEVSQRFTGTPDDFRAALRLFQGEDGTIGWVSRPPHSGADPSSVALRFFDQGVSGFGECTAEQDPGGESLIAVFIPDQRAEAILAIWSEIYAHLRGRGFFEAGLSRDSGVEAQVWKRTEGKLSRLHKLHMELLQDHRPLPTLAAACQQLQIDPRTVKKYAPELVERWDDRELRQA